MAKGPLAYPDACLFLNVIKKEQPFWPNSLKVLLAAERGDLSFCASTLLYGELVGWNGDADERTRNSVVDQYLLSLDLQWVEVDLHTVQRAAELASRFRLRGADAIHLASAVRLGADYFLTWDQRFPVGAEVEGVKIRNPGVIWDRTMDDELVDKKIGEELGPSSAD